MKTITLKLKYKIFEKICGLLSYISLGSTGAKNIDMSIERKAAYSIAFLLSKKLRKKLIDKENTTGDFKLKLNYHEAYSLYIMLQTHAYSFNDCYTETMMQKIINELNQQLI